MALKGFVVAVLAVLVWGRLASSQTLTLSDCAANCTSEITGGFSACKFGIQCFCTDPRLLDLGKQCWESNCTVREALTAENITSISCNFPNRDRGPASSAVTFTSMAVALCLVGTRIVAMSPDFRVLWGWDDVLVGFATVLMIGNAICNPVSRHYGYGRDTWRLPFDNTKTVEMIFYIGGVLYAVGIASTKVAFLVFYIKLFPSKTFRWVAFPLLVATLLHGLTFTFLFIFQCSPISYAWTQWDGTGQGKCLNFDLGAVMHAITNIVLDLLIFALPIWQLWSLSLSRKKKFQVISMFCVGFFVTLVSILRLWSMTSLGDTWNPTWDFVPFGYWSDLEFNVGIACICMPSLRVVLRRYFPTFGLASTHHEGSVSGPDMTAASAARPVTLTQSSVTGKMNLNMNLTLKSFRSSTRHVKGDDASDQVELCEYNTVVEPK